MGEMGVGRAHCAQWAFSTRFIFVFRHNCMRKRILYHKVQVKIAHENKKIAKITFKAEKRRTHKHPSAWIFKEKFFFFLAWKMLLSMKTIPMFVHTSDSRRGRCAFFSLLYFTVSMWWHSNISLASFMLFSLSVGICAWLHLQWVIMSLLLLTELCALSETKCFSFSFHDDFGLRIVFTCVHISSCEQRERIHILRKQFLFFFLFTN